MSVYSTLSVNRITALAALAQARFGYLSDQELGDQLDEFVEHRLHNVMVTSTGGDDAELADIIGLDMPS